MFLVRCSFIFILFFLINFFITSSFAQTGALNLPNGGTHINNSNLSGSDYAIYGSGNNELTVTNNATLSANTFDGMWNCCFATTTFINNGSITAVRNGIGQFGGSSISFTNNASINVTGTKSGSGVGFYSYGTGTYVNTGTITGREGMILEGGNHVIRNTGVITASVVDLNISSGTVTSLTNSEGGNNVLTYSGKVPTNYYIIISSLNNYGKLSVTNPTDSMTFNIDNTSSVALNSTYSSVLQGSITLSNTQGTYGGYRWNLVRNGSDYDLIITASRLAYNEIVTTIKLVNTATQLEAIRTNGTKSTLTNTLDNLSAAQLESAVKKIQGTSIVKTSTQSVQAQSNFKTALSAVTSPGSSSSITNVTKTNQGNLTFADLQK